MHSIATVRRAKKALLFATLLAASAPLYGCYTPAERALGGGMIGMAGHIQIGDDVVITGMSTVSASLAGPGMYSSGIPAEPSRRWRRLVARFRKLEPIRRQTDSNQGNEDE